MIRLSDVVKEYESGTTALKGISLRIEDGEFVFLVGPSGSGKSTIIKLLTGEIVPTSGQIAVNGFSLTNIAERQIPLLRRSVGVIFQDFRLIEKKTVYENLGFAMRAVGSSPREIKKRIPYVLELVGLEEKTDRYPNELSGGEQQRVAIARALINNPSTIIADERRATWTPRARWRSCACSSASTSSARRWSSSRTRKILSISSKNASSRSNRASSRAMARRRL